MKISRRSVWRPRIRRFLSLLPNGFRLFLWRILYKLRVPERVSLFTSLPMTRLDQFALSTAIHHYANGVWRNNRRDALALERLREGLKEWDRRGYPEWPDIAYGRKILVGKAIEPVWPESCPNIWEVIEKRRSYRKFGRKPVSREAVEKILNAGNWAPSACNRQGWRFVVMGSGPVRIYVVCDERFYSERDGTAMDAAAVAQNCLLAATALGLGSLWINYSEIEDQSILARDFALKPYERIQVMVLVGHPTAPSAVPSRRPLEAITEWIDKDAALSEKELSLG